MFNRPVVAKQITEVANRIRWRNRAVWVEIHGFIC